MEEHHIPDTFLIEQGSQQPGEPKPETAVRWAAILEKIQVELDRVPADSFFRSLFDQNIITVFPLCTGCNFHLFPKQVKAFCLVWLILLSHVVEGTHVHGIIGHKNKLVTILFPGVFT